MATVPTHFLFFLFETTQIASRTVTFNSTEPMCITIQVPID